ncbi:MAG: FHA domain-containing protein [Oscillatoriales cyanobacterium RM1_1_9]|nr:FHA domain-containing protein [Oscillatoriales cyanobacterium SM2_3_0]NJO46840.1 FHA domain-containing protein [Oscillatoriales cyanobacterium RM2_1_1]NJO70949.1 FHA domain-containing protein [Oscillatoriales cyanobacterium RM1_1_9]
MPYLIHNPYTSHAVTYELQFGLNTIGRSKNNTICLTDVSLSRQHARIEVTEQGTLITDLNSSNHTFVNETQITQCQLKAGDLIRCGAVVFRFTDTIKSSRRQPKPKAASSTSIVKQFSPAGSLTSLSMKELLYSDSRSDSVIKLKQQQHEGQRAIDKLKILLEVCQELASPYETQQLIEKVLTLLFKIVSVDRVAILLLNSKTKTLEQKAVKFRHEIFAEDQFYSTRIINLAREQGNTILTADALVDERFQDSESVLAQAIHASVCIPLKPRDEVIGVLYMDNLSLSDVYSDEDVEFLTALAGQAAIAIDNAELSRKMREEAVARSALERFFVPAVSRKLREEGKLGILEANVTALFSDITRFTQMSARMEPRQVIAMLNEYFKVMVEDIVFPYEGTLEKYIGDALVAVWGAPYAHPDDTLRAVQAAIEMQQAVAQMNAEWVQRYNEPIHIHIGLNTGPVATGNIGSEKLVQYAHIGDTMNVASRICGVAQANEIIISQATFEKLADQDFIFDKLEPVLVKGKNEPLQLYKLQWENL